MSGGLATSLTARQQQLLGWLLRLDFNLRALAEHHSIPAAELAEFTASPAVQRAVAALRSFAAFVEPMQRAAARREATSALVHVLHTAAEPATILKAASTILRAPCPGARARRAHRNIGALRARALERVQRYLSPAGPPRALPVAAPTCVPPASTLSRARHTPRPAHPPSRAAHDQSVAPDRPIPPTGLTGSPAHLPAEGAPLAATGGSARAQQDGRAPTRPRREPPRRHARAALNQALRAPRRHRHATHPPSAPSPRAPARVGPAP